MKAVVTGGAGFIGSNVVDALVARGDEVTVVDDISTGRRENLEGALASGRVKLVEADIRDAQAMREILGEAKPEVVFHLAAQIDVRKSVNDPVNDATQNVLGSLNLLEGAHEAKANGKRAPRIVFASTGGAIYGDLVTPPNVETYLKNPESPYGIAKLSVELYMGYYARQQGLECATLRYSNVYGPRQDPHGEAGVVAIFCDRILDGRAMTTFGDGSQTRDYVFVKDVAAANWRAATATLPPLGDVDARAFNIGTGIETSVNDLAADLKHVAGADTPIERAPARAGELQRSSVSIEKARNVLGWTPQVTLRDGLRETFEFFAARRGAATAAA